MNTKSKKNRKAKKKQSPLAHLSDRQILAEIEDARREEGEVVRTGAELVALNDALRQASDLGYERLVSLREKQAAIANDVQNLVGDMNTLDRERIRLQKEVDQRFGGDWATAQNDSRPATPGR